MKKYIWIIPYGLVIAGLVIAAFYDYAIAAFLYDPANLYGVFFERLILFPIGMLVPFCCFGFYRLYEKKRYYLCFILTCGYVLFDMAHYWVSLTEHMIYILPAFVLLWFITHLLFAKIPISFWIKNERFLWFLLVVFLSSMFTTWILKQGWGRIRYREMLTDATQFTPWYTPQGYTGHRSFPSGHTTVMSVLLCFLYIYKDKEPMRSISIWYELLIGISIILMMVSRMLLGAHFLSDVLMGFAITYTMVQIWRRRFFRRGEYQ